MAKINNDRLLDFQKAIGAAGLDAYVVTRLQDMGYLTGYMMEGYSLLITKKNAWAFLQTMLVDQFKATCSFVKAECSDDYNKALAKKAEELGLKKVGFDSDTESYLIGKFWRKNKFVEAPSMLKPLREVKRADEIKIIRQSCHIAAKAYEVIKKKVKPGRTEISVARELEDIMQAMGAKTTSFDTIVGSGPNSSRPHHVTSERKIRSNEPVLIDFGCVYNSYCSDITRTFFVGKPTARFNEMLALVQKSHDAGVAAIHPGMKTFDADKVCRDIIAEAGYGDKFIHGTGHGVGLEIHESPRLNTVSPAVLREGLVVTVEPGVYFEGKFGIRVEDTVLVTKKGCEILTK